MPVITNVFNALISICNAVGVYAWDIVKAVTLLK